MLAGLRRLLGFGPRPAAAIARPLASALDEAALKAALHRPAWPLTVGGFSPTGDPLATVFGEVRMGPRGAVWPTRHGRPLHPLLQINLTTASGRPEGLADLAFIAIFAAESLPTLDYEEITANVSDDNAAWAIWTARGLGDLSPVTAADHGSPIKPFECRWQDETPDYANHDVAGEVVDTEANDVYAYEWGQTLYKTKLGGWPGTIQSEPWWDYQKTEHDWAFVLQIGEEPKSLWALPFVGIARAKDAPDRWAMELQLD